MKFILFDVREENKAIQVNEYEIFKDKKIKEIILSKSKLNEIANLRTKSKQGIIGKIKLKTYESKLKKIIKYEDARYILASNLNHSDKNIRYLKDILEAEKIGKIASLNEMNTNIFKYIDEYGIKNNLNVHDIKMLFVYKDINNIDFNVLLEAVRNYKKVNIYIRCNANKELLNRIDKLNDSEGSVVEIIKYNKKAFIDYDVIYYADDYRINYPRMRLNKKTLLIDLEDSLKDKFNSNIIFFNEIENKTDAVDYLKERYGLLPLAHVLRQM